MERKFNNALLFGAVFVCLVVGLTSSCKKKEEEPAPEVPGPNEVYIQSSSFSPASITVAIDAWVTWTNQDGIPHTVTGTAGQFGSSNLANGGVFSFKFTTPGTYSYKCSVHSGMTGEVIVQ